MLILPTQERKKNKMRLRVAMELKRRVAIPINHQHWLTGIVYRFLECSDAEYASFLHEEGYTAIPETPEATEEALEENRRFKLFVFSPLRAKRRRVEGSTLWLGPGPVEWLVSSPMEKFLTEFATGLLAGGEIRVGAHSLPIILVETLAPPRFQETTHFTCLSPIVVSVTEGGGVERRKRYLRPTDPEFGERVRQNLLSKYAALHGGAFPKEDRLCLRFDTEYLGKHRGTKLIEYKGIQVVGAFAPFSLSGSVELMRVGYESGLGEKNAGGCGMVEVEND
jgi:CRISPR-associated endoribonuclease Cas6